MQQPNTVIFRYLESFRITCIQDYITEEWSIVGTMFALTY